MGTYDYYISSKSRKVKIDDTTSIDVHFIKYFGKQSWNGYSPIAQARLARINNVQHNSPFCSYASDENDFHHGDFVYKRDAEMGNIYTETSHHLHPYGRLRQVGKRWQLDKFFVLIVPDFKKDRMNEVYELQEKVSFLDWKHEIFFSTSELFLHFLTETDMLAGKLMFDNAKKYDY